MIPLYPSTLPVPSAIAVQPAERRAYATERYPTHVETFERQRRTFERVTWPWMTAATAALWDAWWTTDLGHGGSWFRASWPSMRGQVLTDRHFIETPVWQYRAGGFWQVSALIETRARGSVPARESGIEIAWTEPIYEPGGTLAHANNGTGDCSDFSEAGITSLYAGLVGYTGQTVVWAIASWTPSAGGSSPTLEDQGFGVVAVRWVNHDGSSSPVFNASLGQLVLTATVDDVPIATGQRLVATTAAGGDYASIAWGPE